MASEWQLLDPEDENQLHKSRLFSIEEKPFKRITKRLATITQLANSKLRQTATPPPETTTAHKPTEASDGEQQEDQQQQNQQVDTEDASNNNSSSSDAIDFAQLKEDITLDFAALDSTIGRLQFLQSANTAQRARYAAERLTIHATCTRVRDNTTHLRTQLLAAQATRAQRDAWDVRARAILEHSNKALQEERGKASTNIAKLEAECATLEAESEAYAETWRERRAQFSRIMEESMRLRRLIRDEKEEVERREGMDDEDKDEVEQSSEQQQLQQQQQTTPRPGSASGNATPRPEVGGGLVVVKSGGESTPAASGSMGGRTPLRVDSPAPSMGEGGAGGLKPPPEASGGFSQAGSRSVSREPSPAVGGGEQQEEDVEMGDSSREERTTTTIQSADKMDMS